LLKARSTASSLTKLPGKKAAYSADFIATWRERRVQEQMQQVHKKNDVSSLDYASTNPSQAEAATDPEQNWKKEERKKTLRAFVKRDQEIARKRHDALAKARDKVKAESILSDPNHNHLPGKKMSFSGMYITTTRGDPYNDDCSISTSSTSKSSRSRLDQLYEKGKRDIRSDLEKSIEVKNEETRVTVPSLPPTTVRVHRDNELTDRKSQQIKMYELLKKNKDFALKRRGEIERARSNVVDGPIISIGRDDDDARSVSSTSVSSQLSTISTSSRLNQLYERGKQKRLSDLRRSTVEVKKQERVLEKTRKAGSKNTRCNKLYELSRRNFEAGKKRRADIAKSRLEAISSLKPLSNDEMMSTKREKIFDSAILKGQELSTMWYFENPSLKSHTSSTEEEKISRGSSASSGESSGSEENNENAFSYGFMARNYPNNQNSSIYG
jgi:hypothetical protein